MTNLEKCRIDPSEQRGQLTIEGETFQCVLETDWTHPTAGPYPKRLSINGEPIAPPSGPKFGMNNPWDWTLDLDAADTESGVLVRSQGFRSMSKGRIPFRRTRRVFWSEPEMLYERTHLRHLSDEPPKYVISRIPTSDIELLPSLDRVTYARDGYSLHWQFQPTPVDVTRDGETLVFEFDQPQVETLFTWSDDPAPDPPQFESISSALDTVELRGPAERRTFNPRVKHDYVGPNERVTLPAGQTLVTGVDDRSENSVQLLPGMQDLVVRRYTEETVSIGSMRLFQFDEPVESDRHSMIGPTLARSIRSLLDRGVFGVVPEDDPESMYSWGTGTWPRCFTVIGLDAFGFADDAFNYLAFMMNTSRQFERWDDCAHLCDNFTIRGEPINRDLYDDNGHAIKLYEAGKFYRRHRDDMYGERLLTEYYDVLKQWCEWIEGHMQTDGAVRDPGTESQVWAPGYGTFTQAPAAAGFELFKTMAADANRPSDAEWAAETAAALLKGLQSRLVGDAANPYHDLPAGLGECYLTFVPDRDEPRNWSDDPVDRIGLSCYSLAASFFLQDPDVGLLPDDDPVAERTLDLVLEHAGTNADDRIVTWHIDDTAHIGYGQLQLLQCLAYAERWEEFENRLDALFDISRTLRGDAYLLPEVFGPSRFGHPNRGNKAHLAYYPVLVDYLRRNEDCPERTVDATT